MEGGRYRVYKLGLTNGGAATLTSAGDVLKVLKAVRRDLWTRADDGRYLARDHIVSVQYLPHGNAIR